MMGERKKSGSTTATLERLKQSGQLAALTRSKSATTSMGVLELSLERIVPDPDQPRRAFDPEKLASLAASIKAQGVLQPITVQPLDGAGKHVIIMGERRYRAAHLAGLSAIPALIRKATPALRMAQLTENVQRADLTTLEIARAVDAMRAAGQSRAEIATALGWNEGEVSRFAAVTKMPDDLQRLAGANAPIRSLADLNALWKRDEDAVRRFLGETEPHAVNRSSVEALRARIDEPECASAPQPVSAEASEQAPSLDANVPSQPSVSNLAALDRLRVDAPVSDRLVSRTSKGIALICQVGEDIGRIDMMQVLRRAGHLAVRFDNGDRTLEIALAEIRLIDVVALD